MVGETALGVSLLAPWVGEIQEYAVNGAAAENLSKIIRSIKNEPQSATKSISVRPLCGENHTVGDPLHSKIADLRLLSCHTAGKAALSRAYLEIDPCPRSVEYLGGGVGKRLALVSV